MMKKLLLLLLFFSFLKSHAQRNDSLMLAQIHQEVLTHGECYGNLQYLCKQIGQRLAGSESAAKAIEWGKQTLEKNKAAQVTLMPVEVPHWTRGKFESGTYSYSGSAVKSVALTALGGSVGTNGVITAEIVEVKSFDELHALGEEKVKGKIVFFNKAMDAALINTGAAYGGAYPIRGQGPSEAGKMGAVACLIRSLTLADDNYPHTGGTHYQDSIPKIPAAELSAVGARQLSQELAAHPDLKFSLQLSCEAFPRTMQANVVAEMKGSLFPDEYITIGGHLDSWDIGEGAHDDGTGIVQSIEVLRALAALGYTPKHSIRVVLFINEEFGNDGGETYARVAKEKDEIHVAAIESDAGGFSPMGFNCELNDHQYALFSSWAPLFEPYNIFRFRQGGSGVDVRPLKGGRVGLFGLIVDGQRYFDYHHSNNDVFENVNKRELELGAAAMASLVYLIDQTGLPTD